jgi:hypothetical protein
LKRLGTLKAITRRTQPWTDDYSNLFGILR